jgi:hypothetical protein
MASVGPLIRNAFPGLRKRYEPRILPTKMLFQNPTLLNTTTTFKFWSFVNFFFNSKFLCLGKRTKVFHVIVKHTLMRVGTLEVINNSRADPSAASLQMFSFTTIKLLGCLSSDFWLCFKMTYFLQLRRTITLHLLFTNNNYTTEFDC